MVNVKSAMLEHRLPYGVNIKSCFQVRDEHYVILVERKDDHTPYVVASFSAGDAEWGSGQYFTNIWDAAGRFVESCQSQISFMENG